MSSVSTVTFACCSRSLGPCWVCKLDCQSVMAPAVKGTVYQLQRKLCLVSNKPAFFLIVVVEDCQSGCHTAVLLPGSCCWCVWGVYSASNRDGTEASIPNQEDRWHQFSNPTSCLWSILLCEYLLPSPECPLHLSPVIAKWRHWGYLIMLFLHVSIAKRACCFRVQYERLCRMVFNLSEGQQSNSSSLCSIFQKRHAGFKSYCDLEVLWV